jgi:CBS domain-containing protein
VKVAEIMQTDLLRCPPETTVREAARLMGERKVGACVVLSGSELVGMFSERDVVRAVATGEDVRERSVGETMSGQAVAAPPDADLQWVADTMRRLGVRHLPVAEGGMVAGVVSLRDLFVAVEAVLRLDPRGASAALEVLAATRN